MAEDIPDGFSIPLKRGLLIRPIRRSMMKDLIEYTADMPLVERARIFRQYAEKHVIYGRIPLADEDAVFEVLHAYSDKMEAADRDSFRDGCHIAKVAPHLLKTTCDQCRTWAYSGRTGQLLRDVDGNPLKRDKTDPADVPDCDKPPALKAIGSFLMSTSVPMCEKGHYSTPKSFSKKTLQAWNHYWQCVSYDRHPTGDEISFHNRQLIEKFMQEKESKKWIGPTVTSTTYTFSGTPSSLWSA